MGFYFAEVFLSTYLIFPLPPRIDKVLGNWHVTRQVAPNCSVGFPVLN
jgi:hypothetical protein